MPSPQTIGPRPSRTPDPNLARSFAFRGRSLQSRASWGGSSVGRASRSQRGGRGFKSLPLHQVIRVRVMFVNAARTRRLGSFCHPTRSGGGECPFEVFIGVGPRRFFDLFPMNLSSGRRTDRRDPQSGKALEPRTVRRIRTPDPIHSLLDLEISAANEVDKVIHTVKQEEANSDADAA